MSNRKIIHVDMDAFYASVEQLDNPELRGKPVAVGGNSERGVIAAASYEARKFGVKSAMSSKMAARMCPDLIFVRPNFQRYKEISKHIHNIFKRYTDAIEPLALDEAFLDVTENKMGLNSATFIAQSIKNDIFTELNLIASAGVSYNKFLAKLASDQDKPNGLYVIKPEEAVAYMESLPVERFFGVGKVTAEKMHSLQIYKGKDLMKYSVEELQSNFGKIGSFLFSIVRGIDEREVISNRERKSIGAETTFSNDIFDETNFRNFAFNCIDILWKRYKSYPQKGRTLTIKLKYNDFTQVTRSITETVEISSKIQLEQLADRLIELVLPLDKSVRLIGFQISGFATESKDTQLTMDDLFN
ncbi:MAG: DNA polymerase IV [Flavobacteriia bacterium]|nr:DNA polymerase IV [Flavobacteriia bacterium]